MPAIRSSPSRSLPESSVGVAGRVTLEPETRDVTVLAIEMRRYARSRTTTAAQESADRLGRDLRRVTAAIASPSGML